MKNWLEEKIMETRREFMTVWKERVKDRKRNNQNKNERGSG